MFGLYVNTRDVLMMRMKNEMSTKNAMMISTIAMTASDCVFDYRCCVDSDKNCSMMYCDSAGCSKSGATRICVVVVVIVVDSIGCAMG